MRCGERGAEERCGRESQGEIARPPAVHASWWESWRTAPAAVSIRDGHKREKSSWPSTAGTLRRCKESGALPQSRAGRPVLCRPSAVPLRPPLPSGPLKLSVRLDGRHRGKPCIRAPKVRLAKAEPSGGARQCTPQSGCWNREAERRASPAASVHAQGPARTPCLAERAGARAKRAASAARCVRARCPIDDEQSAAAVAQSAQATGVPGARGAQAGSGTLTLRSGRASPAQEATGGRGRKGAGSCRSRTAAVRMVVRRAAGADGRQKRRRERGRGAAARRTRGRYSFMSPHLRSGETLSALQQHHHRQPAPPLARAPVLPARHSTPRRQRRRSAAAAAAGARERNSKGLQRAHHQPSRSALGCGVRAPQSAGLGPAALHLHGQHAAVRRRHG
jgi:hypothetical protein